MSSSRNDMSVGANPCDIEDLVARMVRDQYQGGATVMTAISGIEIALWDILGKDCGKPVYQLLGGRCHPSIPAYANGWYGGARTPDEYARRAKQVVGMGYGALKFDPFGVAWKELRAGNSGGVSDWLRRSARWSATISRS